MQTAEATHVEVPPAQPNQIQGPEQGPRIDPLSEVLMLMKPQTIASGGFAIAEDMAVFFPKHTGVKCYALLEGECWLVMESLPEPLLLRAGDCFLLPRGLPFTLTCDLALEPVLYSVLKAQHAACNQAVSTGRYIAGGFFAFNGGPATMLLQSLPPVVHIRREADKTALRWSLERMRDEIRNPQPGSALITQQLAYSMLVQALRLHVTEIAGSGQGWLAALSDRHIGLAITSMHETPGSAWTLQSLAERVGMSRSVFALRFREIVGTAPMEYLTRWRMYLAANRLRSSTDSLTQIAQSLGYVSDSAFGKAFRRVMGCSPRQYTRTA